MKMIVRRSMLATATLLACTMGTAVHANPAMVDASLKDASLRYVESEVLVQFKPGMQAVAQRALGGMGLQTAKVLRSAARGADAELHLVRLPAGLKVSDAMQKLRANNAVKFVEPNWILSTAAAPNDPYYTDGRLWGFYGDTSPVKTNQFGSQAGESYDAGRKCNGTVLVGIIDEGVMTNHPDTQANVWVNPFEIANNGIDDDGNGYVDDVNGWDFKNNDKTTFDGTTDDHGTHVSGTIGAVANNGIGIAGVCDNVKMISAKFLEGSGTTEAAILAIDYITDLKTRHNLNIVATNNSWGGGGFSQALKDAIDRAGAEDILFIAAAGNGNLLGKGQNNDKKPSYPASYTSSNIIAVASLTSVGKRSSFSNYGATSVDIAAPGSGIWSTVPTASGPGYASYNGTSMATPHVTGAAALYASLHPGSTAAQIKAAILNSAVPTTSMAGKCVTGGRLNVSGF
ncbi:S8 family peptidase [Ideonella sp.]|uniref:S8 family peptidase n=1 Tax=Ideonella sp. TaxID=1929293 RepID=UPI0037BFF1D1